MLMDIIEDNEFQDLMESHIKATFDYLLRNDQPFGILCQIDSVTFDPSLPENLEQLLDEITLFMIAGYTFESFGYDGRTLTFEAGFGPENFGSIVSMPLLAVKQVLVEETPVLINLARPRKIEPQVDGVKNSLENFLNNPENQKFFKKK